MSVEMDTKAILRKVKSVVSKMEGAVSLNNLFPDSFIQEHSSSKNVRELLSGLNISDQKSFDEWFDSGEEADKYVRNVTDFDSLRDMCVTAAVPYLGAKLAAKKKGTWTDESFRSDDVFDVICINLHLE